MHKGSCVDKSYVRCVVQGEGSLHMKNPVRRCAFGRKNRSNNWENVKYSEVGGDCQQFTLQIFLSVLSHRVT
jgi:hypothetical protein